MNPSDPAESTTPPALTHRLFEAALLQSNGDAGEASMRVIGFLVEALVFAISAATGDDENARKGLLRHIGESIVAAPPHPAVMTTPSEPSEQSKSEQSKIITDTSPTASVTYAQAKQRLLSGVASSSTDRALLFAVENFPLRAADVPAYRDALRYLAPEKRRPIEEALSRVTEK